MVKEIPLTQGKVALVDDKDYEMVSQYKWQASKRVHFWYARHSLYIEGKRTKIYLHRFLLNPEINELCDHINGDGLDNRRCNIRIVTNAQNLMNQRKTIECSSKYKGVCWNKDRNKWCSYIVFNQKQIHLGLFDDEIESARAYDEAAKKYFGEYARLNFNGNYNKG